MTKNFNEFFNINENLYDSISDKLESDKESLVKDLLNAIEETLDSSDLIDLQNWIGKYEDENEDTIIDSLTDDSNIYDFYLKHQDDIDLTLNENEWFDNLSNIDVISLYDIIILGTKEAISLSIQEIKNKLF